MSINYLLFSFLAFLSFLHLFNSTLTQLTKLEKDIQIGKISEFNSKENGQFVTVAIIGTNDIHGAAFPTKLFRSDNNQTYNYGGLEYMATMIKTIKQQYKGNVLYVDSGDQFQGGIQSSPLISNGTIMNDFYNSLEVDASAIGNHQFDFGPKILLPFLTQKSDQSVNLAANLKSEKDEAQFLPKQKNSKLFELKSGIKIGIIGLATMQTPSTTAAFSQKLFPPYDFQPYVDVVINQSRRLKADGANAVLIVSHVGNDCSTTSSYGIWDSKSRQSGNCDESDEISQLIKALPKGTINGVMQGHRHVFSHYYINQIPILGTINGGYYFNVLYLKFYGDKVIDTQIEGPIPVCQRIFLNTRKCGYLTKTELKVAGQLVNWSFHNQPVVSDDRVRSLFNTKWLPLMEPYLVPLVTNQILLEKVDDRESQLANLITNLIHTSCSANDFVIVNPGGFRTTWIPGILLYKDLYNMFPFSNTLISFQINGNELIQMLKILQSGQKGIYHAYGLQQKIAVSRATGNKSLISATFSNGEQIVPTKNYRGVSIDFLIGGGDDFKDVMNIVYTLRKNVTEGEMRGMLREQLLKWGPIKENTLIDPANPRIIIEAQ